MCLARIAATGKERNDDPLMTDVALIEPTDEGLVVTSLLGETRLIEARIERIDFMESIVVVRPTKE